MKKTYKFINQLTEDLNVIAEETDDFDTAEKLNEIVERLDTKADEMVLDEIRGYFE